MRSELSVEDIKWALLIVGIGLILWGIHDFNYANQEPVNIADTGKQNIHAGMVIEGDLPCNYGIFAQATVYGNDAPDKVKYYYLIPVGDGSYMGYLSTASDENLRRQASETAQYLNGVRPYAILLSSLFSVFLWLPPLPAREQIRPYSRPGAQQRSSPAR